MTIPAIPSNVQAQDLVATINDRLRRINEALTTTTTTTSTSSSTPAVKVPGGGGITVTGQVSYGSHTQRLATPGVSIGDGDLWFETDRTVWYQWQAGGVSAGAWHWVDGAMFCAQAALPTDLGTNDAGFLVSVTDYDHVLRWSGSAWAWGPGELGSGYIQGFMVDPNPATGWKLCDGNGDDGSAIGVSHPVKYLKSDGSLGSITSATVAPCLPNLAGSSAFLQFGGTAAGIAAAVAPSLTMNSYTPAGTVSQPTLTMNSYTPAGTVSQPTFTGNTLATHQHSQTHVQAGGNLYSFGNLFGLGSARTATLALTGGTVVSTVTNPELTDAVSAGTPSGTVSQPTFTGSAATLTGTVSQPTFTGSAATLTGTVSATGTPPSVTLRPWFRK